MRETHARKQGILAVALGLSLLALVLPAGAAASGGTISGTITVAATGAPIEGAVACAYEPWTEGFCDEADSSGHYQITGVPPGTYTVGFQKYMSDLLIQYFDHTDEYWEAEHVTVTEGSSRSGVDAALEKEGVITGTVTDAGSGDPISGYEVCVQRTNAGSTSGCEKTDGDGVYTVKKLYPGQYKVIFKGGKEEVGPGELEPFNYVPEYYDGKPTWVASDSVPLDYGTTATGIDATLEEGAEVAGTVTYVDTAGPAEGVHVCAYTAAKGSEVRCVDSDESGNYLLAGLPAGEYKIGFRPGWSSPYARQYYDGATSLAAADPLDLAAGTKTNGIDAALIEAGKVSGTVTAADGGAPLEGIGVCAFEENEFQGATCDQTNADGEYTIPGLEAGAYIVQFNGGFDWLSQYFDGTTSFAEAERVEVENGATKTGINAQMQAAGRIEGTVTDADSSASLQGVEVCVIRSDAPSFFNGNCTTTGSDGHYVIGSLQTGSYDVRFSRIPKGPVAAADRYLTQYYDDAPIRTDADSVAVVEGAATSGIDAAMHHGGRIGGTLRDAQTHLGVEGQICALAVNRSGEGQCTYSDEEGHYTIGGLPTGSYKVRFAPGFSGDMNYLRSFWDGTTNRSEAEPVSVTAGVLTAGIDGEMRRGSRITGTVTDADTHAPIAGVYVCATNFNACANTQTDGSYALEGLPAGTFKLHFHLFGANNPYAPIYYHDAATLAAASSITLAAGQTKANVDQELEKGATISGTVRDAVTKAPLEGISVCASGTAGQEGACRGTDEAGHYSLPGLEPGSYRVRFDHSNSFPADSTAKYVPQYYDDVVESSAATLVNVSSGTLASGIDAELHEGGAIDGQVTIAAGGSPYAGVGVCLIPEAEEEGLEDCTFTDGKGEYALQGLADGAYTVSFYPGLFGPLAPPNLMRQYYDGADTPADADPVTISGGSVVHDVDAALLVGGQISGLVTDEADGSPIEGAEVCAYEVGGEEDRVECARSNAHGEYTISRLPTDSYALEFSVLGYEWEGFWEQGEEKSGSYEEFLTEYYDDAPSRSEADPVAVVAGGEVEEADAQLVAGGAPPWERPALRSAPLLSGDALAGSSLSCSEGSWRHNPTGYSFRWLRDGSPISFPDSPDYPVQAADAGHQVACEVTASNDSGTTKALSNVVQVAGSGGDQQPPAPAPPVGKAPINKPKPKPKCRKGFKRKLVHGKRRCVKVHHRHRRHKR